MGRANVRHWIFLQLSWHTIWAHNDDARRRDVPGPISLQRRRGQNPSLQNENTRLARPGNKYGNVCSSSKQKKLIWSMRHVPYRVVVSVFVCRSEDHTFTKLIINIWPMLSLRPRMKNVRKLTDIVLKQAGEAVSCDVTRNLPTCTAITFCMLCSRSCVKQLLPRCIDHCEDNNATAIYVLSNREHRNCLWICSNFKAFYNKDCSHTMKTKVHLFSYLQDCVKTAVWHKKWYRSSLRICWRITKRPRFFPTIH